jgi:hypothetical protein
MWTVSKNGEGWVVLFDGRVFGSPKPTESEAEAYRERLIARYPNNVGVDVIIGAGRRKHGGPYEVRWPDGNVELLQVPTKADARAVLLYRLKAKRLPNGIKIKAV